MLPIIATLVAFVFAENLAFPMFLAMASSEFAVMTAVVALQK
jgi:hypothetical protein